MFSFEFKLFTFFQQILEVDRLPGHALVYLLVAQVMEWLLRWMSSFYDDSASAIINNSHAHAGYCKRDHGIQ